MAAIPLLNLDPTLEAMKVEVEKEAAQEQSRTYLGMSSIAHPCSRQLWYSFRWFDDPHFKADTLFKFADGHYSEDLTAARLRKVEGIKLTTHLPDGHQIGHVDIEGHFRGHMDGKIEGLKQAPKTPHVWEHKCVNETKFKKLKKLVETLGEKNALEEWDEIYYGQAILYMAYSGLSRHYLTVTTSGSREITSCRTDANGSKARELIRKAEHIITSPKPPEKMSQEPSHWLCKMCSFVDACHYGKEPKQSCRSCQHSYPAKDAAWFCKRWDSNIPTDAQRIGCDDWLALV